MIRALAITLLGLAACACAPEQTRVEHRIYALGTWVEIELEGATPASAEAALAEVERFLQRFERDYHAWNDGELAALNEALAAGRSMRVSAGLADLLREAARLSAASRGRFDPGIGALVELWGFSNGVDAAADPPAAAAVERWLDGEDSIAGLVIEDGVVSSASRTLTIDLGGIAKGEAVDRVIAILRNHGIARGLVNAGGDVRVLGRRAERRWRVGIQAPRGGGLLGTIALEPGEAVFTSGDYERFYMHEGRRVHHILSPATGRPVEHTQAVTVLADTGVRADAAATALLVAGPDEWLELAEALGIAVALRVDASGTVSVSSAMRDRLQAAAGVDVDIMSPSQ